MTDIEQKPQWQDTKAKADFWSQRDYDKLKAELKAAIEQHEAFRQEVSDALSVYQKADGVEERSRIWDALIRFIIAKPDPLVEAMQEWWDADGYASIDTFRAIIEKRGGKIVWGEG